MSSRLRVGVIGCGLIAQVMHLHYLRELSDRFEIAAVCDLSESVRSAVGREYGVARQFAAWQDLVAEPIDAVFVLTSGSDGGTPRARGKAHVLLGRRRQRDGRGGDQSPRHDDGRLQQALRPRLLEIS